MLTRLGNETLTVVHAALVVDSWDKSQYRDWGNATSTDILNCMVQPFLMSNKLVTETSDYREYMSEVFRIWVPPDTVVDYEDRLVWRTQDLDVFGGFQTWHTRNGRPHHIQFIGKRRAG